MNQSLHNQVDTLVKRLLVLAAVSHHWHLTTPSFAQHLAFGELYDYAHEAADKLSETTQGADFPKPADAKVSVAFLGVSSAVPEIEKVVAAAHQLTVNAEKAGCQWISNTGQEIEAGINAILYKLKRLS